MSIRPLRRHVPGESGQTLTQMKVLYGFLAVVLAVFLYALVGAVYLALEGWRYTGDLF